MIVSRAETSGHCFREDAGTKNPNSSAVNPQQQQQQQLRFENWSQQQQLLNHFWRRLQKEYLPTLSKRTKWNFAEEPLKRGYVVWIFGRREEYGLWDESQLNILDEMELLES